MSIKWVFQTTGNGEQRVWLHRSAGSVESSKYEAINIISKWNKDPAIFGPYFDISPINLMILRILVLLAQAVSCWVDVCVLECTA